jgi:hypothetical protein
MCEISSTDIGASVHHSHVAAGLFQIIHFFTARTRPPIIMSISRYQFGCSILHTTRREQNMYHSSSLITLFQVRDRDGGVCRVTGVASDSYRRGRGGEALEKNVGYRCFLMCEVAHGMPWSVDQPVRNVYVCMLSLAERYRRLVLGAYSKALGRIWSVYQCRYSTNAMLLQAPIHKNFQNYKLYFGPGVCSSSSLSKGIFILFISLCCEAE